MESNDRSTRGPSYSFKHVLKDTKSAVKERVSKLGSNSGGERGSIFMSQPLGHRKQTSADNHLYRTPSRGRNRFGKQSGGGFSQKISMEEFKQRCESAGSKRLVQGRQVHTARTVQSLSRFWMLFECLKSRTY